MKLITTTLFVLASFVITSISIAQTNAPVNAATGLSTSAIATTLITVNWTDTNTDDPLTTTVNENETGYRVFIIDGVTNLPIRTVDLPANSVTYNVTGLSQQTAYCFGIATLGDASAEVAYSTLTCATTKQQCIPSQPSMTNSGSTFTTACFLWTDVCGDYNRFFIERSINGGAFMPLTTVGAATLNYCDINLTEGNIYAYRVWSRDDVHNVNSDYSPAGQIQMLKHVAPNAPFGLTATKSATSPKTQVKLSWTLGSQDNLTNNPAFMQIFRSSVSATSGFVLIADAVNLYNTYTDVNLSPKGKYWYRVVTVGTGPSAPSNTAYVQTDGPPATPSHLSVEAARDALNNSIIKLAWWDESDDEWAFHIERSIDDNQNFKEIGVVSPNVQNFINIPLTEGVTYFYRVRASNVCGFSGYSEEKSTSSIVTKIPNAPYFLNAKATTPGEIALSWNDDANNEERFVIERSTDGTTFAKVGEASKNILTHVDKGLTDLTLYYYRVRSSNSLGTSSGFAAASVKTLAKASSITNAAADNIVLYPNPTFNAAKITLQDAIGMVAVRVLDRNNREVLNNIQKVNAEGEINLNLSTLAEGTYTINIQTDKALISKRIVKF